MSEIEPQPRRRINLRSLFGFLGTLLLTGGGLYITLAPTPYLIEQPGPTYNTLSSVEGKQLITIENQKTYPTSGELNLLTVTFQGSPTKGASWLDVTLARFTPSSAIVDLVDIYPPDVTENEINEEADVMMIDSQATAKAAALNLLGYKFDTSLKVSLVQAKSPASHVLKAGDTVLTVDGEIATDIDQIRAKVEATKGKRPVVFEIIRDKVKKTVEVTPKLNQGDYRIGMYVTQVPNLPFPININLDNVSGPSGGQIFALAIYDKLTPGSLTGGYSIAGTGTVDPAGNIGPIGGIQQKIYGAKGAGAEFFFAPSSNCEELNTVPTGIQVVKVSTLKDSLAALKAIREGKANTLASCTK